MGTTTTTITNLSESTLTDLQSKNQSSNSSFSDLLLENLLSNKDLKTVSNGIHIERAIDLLESFQPSTSSDESASQNGSDINTTDIPRVGKSFEVGLKGEKNQESANNNFRKKDGKVVLNILGKDRKEATLSENAEDTQKMKKIDNKPSKIFNLRSLR